MTKNGFIICMAWCSASVALSVPSAYVSKFGALPIQNTTQSDLVRDTESSQTVWVLPPRTGLTKFTGFWASGNLGFCSGLKNLYTASNNIDNQITSLTTELGSLASELGEKKAALDEAKKDLAKVSSTPSMEPILALETQIESLEFRRSELLTSLESCEETCDELKEEYRANKESVRTIRTDLKKLRDKRGEAVQEYDRLKAIADARQEEFDTFNNNYLAALEKLEQVKSTLRSLYANDARIEGGYAMIDYDLGWRKSVSSLEQEYPDFDFRQVPTANVRLNAALVSASSENGYFDSIPAILDYSLDGVPYLPWGENQSELSSLPDVLSGSIRLSLIGACPLATDKFFDESTGTVLSDNSGNPLFGVALQYQYPAAYKTKVTASYNLWKVYEKVVKNGKRGGFFSTKAYAEVVEKPWTSDEFQIDWKIEDPNSIYTEKVRAEIQDHLKSQLMNRLLSIVGNPVPGKPEVTMPAPGSPPEPGALVMANGLQSTCGFNFYCQAAGWILRAGNSIWGNTSTESRFKQSFNATVKETWSSETTTMLAGVATFQR
ncbi:MAG: hypothetical protein AB7T49_05085 [Oligoflexales bacterium]